MSYAKLVYTLNYLNAGATAADTTNYPKFDQPPAGTTLTVKYPVAAILDAASVPPVTFYPQPIVCTFDTDGNLLDPAGNVGVWIIDPRNASLQPHGYTLNATLTFPGPGTPVTFAVGLNSAGADGSFDISLNSPVPPASGSTITVGTQGPAGSIEFLPPITGAPGTDVELVNTGTPEAAQVQLTIPRGDVGNPTAYELRGSGSPYNVVTPASAGIYYTDTAATCGAIRWVSTGITNTSWIVTVGDTGWRDVTSLAAASGFWSRAAGSDPLALRRINAMVYLLVPPSQTTGTAMTNIMAWPAGFTKSPAGPAFHPALLQSSGAFGGYINTHPLGLYVAYTPAATAIVSLAWFATSDPWPTTLPGSPA